MMNSTTITEAFVVKFAASGHILHYKGPMKVFEDGSLQVEPGVFYRPKYWFRTMEEAKEAYRGAVAYTIRSRLKQVDELKRRLDAPEIDLRVLK